MKLSKLAIAAAFTTALIAAPASARGHRAPARRSAQTQAPERTISVPMRAPAQQGPNPSAIEITQCGATISQPGDYSIPGRLDCAVPGPAVIIASDNVHLSISGTLSNPLDDRRIGGGFGIGGSGNNLRIDGGGSVYGNFSGIGLQGNNITVSNLSVSMASVLGGITFLIDGNNVTVKNCHIYGGGAGLGVRDNATIQNNLIGTADPNKGALSVGDNATVTGNRLQINPDDGSEGSGIFVGSNSKIINNKNFGSISISDNSIVTHNSGIGLIGALQGAVNNTIENNSAVEGRDDNGPPCVNTWKNNKLQTETGAVACIQ